MKRLFLVLTIGWIVFIFYQGTRTGEVSMEKSNEIVEQIVNIIEKPKPSTSDTISTPEEKSAESVKKEEEPSVNKLQTMLSYWIRKGAHFFEYLVLAVLLYGVLNDYPISNVNRVVYLLFILLGVAVLDEYVQSFVQRTSSVSDILIDFSGGLVALSVIGLWKRLKLKKLASIS